LTDAGKRLGRVRNVTCAPLEEDLLNSFTCLELLPDFDILITFP